MGTLEHPRRAVRLAATLAFGLSIVLASSTVAEESWDLEPEPPVRWLLLGDLRLRYDRIALISGETVERERAALRAGVRWILSDTLELGGGLQVAAGGSPARAANDNESRDGLRLDEAFLRWTPSERWDLTVGKAALPLQLSPMLWDDDLRPLGVALGTFRPLGDFDELRGVAGYFAPDHRLGDDSRLAAVQGAWLLRQGASVGGELLVSFLQFEDLDRLVSSGLSRTNRRAGSTLRSDFELIDLQGAVRWPAGAGELEASLDAAVNLGADDEDRAMRADLVWSQRGDPGLLELGVAAERIERDAVPAAFNSDDWWFHSRMRGVSAWVRVSPNRSLSLSAAFFSERLDPHTSRTERLLVDLDWRF